MEDNLKFTLQHSINGELMLTTPDGISKSIRRVYVANPAMENHFVSFELSDRATVTLSYKTP